MDEYVFGTNATGGTGLGGTYKEYRSLSPSSSGTLVDEELQIWHWGNSYATQYRDVNGAGDAAHQAWSFGGTATAAMPLGGNANYAGKYGATSKTWNWIDDPLNLAQTLSANGSWRVEGDSSIQADFGAATMTGTLTPNTWTGVQTLNGGIGPKTVISSNAADPNWVPFMATNVILTGKITGNTVSGKAELDPTAGWVSGINPMNAGFFGPAAPNPTEVTGDYNFVAVTPKPIGGVPPINNDVRGFVQQSGVFHAQ